MGFQISPLGVSITSALTGTNDASHAIKSIDSSTTCVVPSSQGLLRRCDGQDTAAISSSSGGG